MHSSCAYVQTPQPGAKSRMKYRRLIRTLDRINTFVIRHRKWVLLLCVVNTLAAFIAQKGFDVALLANTVVLLLLSQSVTSEVEAPSLLPQYVMPSFPGWEMYSPKYAEGAWWVSFRHHEDSRYLAATGSTECACIESMIKRIREIEVARQARPVIPGWRVDVPHYRESNEDCMGMPAAGYWRVFADDTSTGAMVMGCGSTLEACVADLQRVISAHGQQS